MMIGRYDLSAMRVLILDDEGNMLSLIGAMLTRLGVGQVQTARDAPRAIDLVSVFQPDLILVDWELGGMSGYEFVKRVRMLNDGEEIGLFMVTGFSEVERVKAALTAGVDDFLAKPLAAGTLQRRINRFIDLRPHLKWRFRNTAVSSLPGSQQEHEMDARSALTNDEISALFD